MTCATRWHRSRQGLDGRSKRSTSTPTLFSKSGGATASRSCSSGSVSSVVTGSIPPRSRHFLSIAAQIRADGRNRLKFKLFRRKNPAKKPAASHIRPDGGKGHFAVPLCFEWAGTPKPNDFNAADPQFLDHRAPRPRQHTAFRPVHSTLRQTDRQRES